MHFHCYLSGAFYFETTFPFPSLALSPSSCVGAVQVWVSSPLSTHAPFKYTNLGVSPTFSSPQQSLLPSIQFLSPPSSGKTSTAGSGQQLTVKGDPHVWKTQSCFGRQSWAAGRGLATEVLTGTPRTALLVKGLKHCPLWVESRNFTIEFERERGGEKKVAKES